MAGTKDYEDYVEKFREWEEQLLSSISEIQDSITRRPVTQTPQLPTQDLDGQLYSILDNIPMAKFTAALVQLCKQDHSIFNLMTDVSIFLLNIHLNEQYKTNYMNIGLDCESGD